MLIKLVATSFALVVLAGFVGIGSAAAAPIGACPPGYQLFSWHGTQQGYIYRPIDVNDDGYVCLGPEGSIVDNDYVATVPTDKDACKNGGWQSLARADGSSFKNQGDCIQYVNTGK